jgi:dCMP deaminase
MVEVQDALMKKAETVRSRHKKTAADARPGWDEYFIGIAQLVAQRSTCLRRKVGALVVKDRRILATGYNGTPSGIRHCGQVGCLREKLKVPSGQRHELCRGLHAEQNVLLQASLHGVSLRESVMYVTNQPCIICAKMIINAGIREVVVAGSYPDSMAEQFLKEARVRLRRVRANTRGSS